MRPTIAFVGAGPTAIYTLHALLNHATESFDLTIFEAQSVAGRGTPYRPGWNDPAMLSNIASLELPPLADTLVAWLRQQSESRLLAIGIDPNQIDDRVFYPRLALGEYFKDQFQALIARAATHDVIVNVQTKSRVVDAFSTAEGVNLLIEPHRGKACEAQFDHLVLATGHQWPANPEARPGYFLSPWPASALAHVPARQVGIRGTSLTAIDAAVALAVLHGEFLEEGRRLRYVSTKDTDNFHMTMMSRKGLLPEADFFHPLPYEPLTIFTPKALDRLMSAQDGDLLEQTFSLFKNQLGALDPDYAEKVHLSEISLEAFCDRYFADRMAADPFTWAKDNLVEAEINYAKEVTVPWRYGILRMHEVIDAIVPELGDKDFQRFMRYFKPVFVDDYATVPHESIKRLLALHQAGKLDLLALGDDYTIDSHRPECGAVLKVGAQIFEFPVFIEAMGQRPLGTKDFPFPSLRRQGIVRDASSAEPADGSRGIVIDDQFHLMSDDVPVDQLFCVSLPFILGRHPFIQGITSSHDMGEVVGKALAAAISRTAQTRSVRRSDLQEALS